jgi:prefoldin subunit 5
MIGQVETSVDDSLRLTGEALSALTDSITVTNSIVDSVRTGMTSIRTTLATVQTSLGNSASTLTQGRDFLGGSLPTALDAVNGVLPTIESVAKSVNDTLVLVSKVPFGPNYAPVEPFDQAIARLSTALAPLPGELRALSKSFDDLTTITSTMGADVARLGADIEALNTKLADVAPLLDRYTATALRAKALAQTSRKDLSRSATLTRWMLSLLGVVFALGQAVPIWLGWLLLANEVGTSVVSRSAQHSRRPEPSQGTGS